MARTVVYKLEYPVTLGDMVISEVTLVNKAAGFKGYKPITTHHQDGSMSVENDQYSAAAVAVRLCGQPTTFLDALDGADMKALAEIVLSFFTSGRKTGPTP